MSRREKFLIVLLAALVILLGGFKLLVEPQLKNLAAAKEELAAAENDQQQAEFNMAHAERIEAENTELDSKIGQKAQVFFPELQNDKVQMFFERLAGQANISFHYFHMDKKTTGTIEGFTPQSDALSYPAKDSASSIRSINGLEEKPSAPAGGQSGKQDTGKQDTGKQDKGVVEKMSVSMQFVGSYEQMKTFLDAIRNSGRTVRVSSLSSSVTDNGTLSVEVRAECFGIKKLTDTDPLINDTLPRQTGKTNPYADPNATPAETQP